MIANLPSIAIIIIAIIALSAAAIGIIASSVLYFYPSISSSSSMIGTSGSNQQELIIGERAPPSSPNCCYRQLNITVNGIELVADVAATQDQRTKGLSVKDALAENEAMLFVFDTAYKHPFWMKNMKFPIDIIWLNSDKTVIHIEHNLKPCGFDLFCMTYEPHNNNSKSLYVVETVAGFAEKHNIVEGTTFEFQL
jgi:uncharacterized protein